MSIEFFTKQWATSDIDELVTVHNLGYMDEWDRKKFLEYSSMPQNHIESIWALHRKKSSRLAGYMAWGETPYTLWLHHLVIDPHYRRMGFAHELMSNLKEYRLKLTGKPRISISVTEDNDTAQLWLKRQGFICTSIVQAEECPTPQDCNWYVFEFDSVPNQLLRKARRIGNAAV